jgi:hypothetical protein
MFGTRRAGEKEHKVKGTRLKVKVKRRKAKRRISMLGTSRAGEKEIQG